MKRIFAVAVCLVGFSANSEVIKHTNRSSFTSLLTLDEEYGSGGEVESYAIEYTPYHTYEIDVGSEHILEFTYDIETSHTVVFAMSDDSVELDSLTINPTSWNPSISWMGFSMSSDDSRKIKKVFLLPVSETKLWGLKSYQGK